MWIILLDHSGSMGDPFEGKTEFAGRTMTTRARVKLDAAKEQLQRHLAGLGSPARIALIEFTGTASVAFSGLSSDTSSVARVLDEITPRDGTNIAAALDVAAETALKYPAELIQVLVISDGLSNLDAAVAAAQRLKRNVFTINVLLIDPTEDGEKLARAIALDGTVAGVTSEAELARGFEERAAVEQKISDDWGRVATRLQQDFARLVHEQPPPERLRFTTGHPSRIDAVSWSALHVFLHVARLEHEVQQRLADLVKTPFRSTATAQSAQPLPRGIRLRIAPNVAGVDFNPVAQEVVWSDDVQHMSFQMRGRPERVGEVASGVIEVTHESLLVATIPVTFSVSTDASGDAQAVAQTAMLIEKVFASYSHADTEIVRACAAAYRALGIYVYLDFDSLTSGQLWEPALRKFIQDSDLFQLFWSVNASRSGNVEQEWREALSIAEQKTEGFIRPVRWEEPWPEPPEPLRRFHFAPLDLRSLPVSPRARQNRSPATEPISAPVIPLLSGITNDALAAIEDEASWAVRFLEETTELRYYPVPTVLVDEQTVRSLWPQMSTDAELARLPRLRAWNDVLRALALEFHVSFGSAKLPMDAFRAGAPLNEKQFERFRHLCEGGFANAVLEALDVPGGITDEIARAALARVDALRTFSARSTNSWFQIFSEVPAALQPFFDRRGIRKDSSSTLRASRTDAALLLGDLRALFVAALERCRDLDPSAAAEKTTLDADTRATIELVTNICGYIANGFSFNAPDELQRIGIVVHPSWRRARNELVALEAPGFRTDMTRLEFFQRTAEVMNAIFRSGLERLSDQPYSSGYPLDETIWSELGDELRQRGIQRNTARSQWEGSIRTMAGPLAAIVSLLEHAWSEILNALASVPPSMTPAERTFAVEAPTFGLYVSPQSADSDAALAKWADDRGVSQQLTMPARARVIFCATAVERFGSQLAAARGASPSNERLARLFVRCVLVHEHFHAIVARGAGSGGQSVADAFPQQWQSARVLNESLAAWMELHAVRGDDEMTALVWRYIRRAANDTWPYKDAQLIERVYESDGVDGVRQWIRRLREDPQGAAASFSVLARA